MSLDAFIPNVWSARLQAELESKYVYGALVNRDYEGDISSYGDRVTIGSIGDITVDDYVKNTTVITPEQIDGTTKFMDIDQSKYFAFMVDDVDTAQTKPDVMSAAMRKAARGLSATADTFLSELMADEAGLTAPVEGELGLTDIPAFMGGIQQALDEADNDPDAERWIVVPAWLKKLIVISFQGNTQSTEVQANGRVGRYFGLTVYMSNRTPKDNGDDVVLAGTTAGVTMAEQINQVEAYRPESSFADAVKGLHLYGAKVVEPSALLKAVVSEAE